MREPTEIEKRLIPLLESTPYELVWVELSKGGNRTVVRVFIDTPGGITIDDIAKASKQISTFLDVEMPVLGNYVLEVSSPGLDRPLMRPEHFKAQIGEKISVHLLISHEGRRNFKGHLKEVTEQGIELLVDGHLYSFTFDDMDKARVMPNIRIGSGEVRHKDEH